MQERTLTKKDTHTTPYGLALAGTEVGYQVGMEIQADQTQTQLIYCTTGVLLEKLIHRKSLEQFTHIIVDEVHERDIDIDLLLLLLKRLFRDPVGNPNGCKIILMSATINTGTLFILLRTIQ